MAAAEFWCGWGGGIFSPNHSCIKVTVLLPDIKHCINEYQSISIIPYHK